MVRVALCAGCRYGISGRIFEEGKKYNIKKFISGASYLELAPFKSFIMKIKGDGDEHKGLLNGINENPYYNYDNNIDVLLKEDYYDHKKQLSGKIIDIHDEKIKYLDFDSYFPNNPDNIKKEVENKLDWKYPESDWHFDCLIEEFKDFFYYGLLGYIENEYKISAYIRHNLKSREDGIKELNELRTNIKNSSYNKICSLIEELELNANIELVNKFYKESIFYNS